MYTLEFGQLISVTWLNLLRRLGFGQTHPPPLFGHWPKYGCFLPTVPGCGTVCLQMDFFSFSFSFSSSSPPPTFCPLTPFCTENTMGGCPALCMRSCSSPSPPPSHLQCFVSLRYRKHHGGAWVLR